MNVSELIERLRTHWESQRKAREADAKYDACCVDLGDEAADALAAQAREIERLRGGFEGACYCCEPVAVVNIELSRRLAAAERELKRYAWLVDHGERCFGSLWREASVGDIDAAMKEGK